MSDHTYKLVDVVGSGPSFDEAIRNAVTRAAQSTRRLEWFELSETRGHIENGAVAHLQVTLRLGFRVDDEEDVSGS